MEVNIKKETTGSPSNQARPRKNWIYTLDVYIVSGPITEKFAKKNPVLSRTIQIRGDQTLEDLHNAIFDAFDREEEHMYEFQIGGKRPMDPNARRYTLGGEADDPGEASTGAVSDTTLDSLGLKVKQTFGYWFDFGDDWWHQINVVAVEDQAVRPKHTGVIKRVGHSPPQYV